MNLNIRKALLIAAAIVLPTASVPGLAQNGGLRAGAARVDITPPLADLPTWFTKINDRIYVRALVLDDGASRAVIVVADAPTIATAVSADLARGIAAQVKAPVENVLVAVTHTHNAVRLDNNPVGVYLPGSAKITAATVAAALDAVKQAAANLQPARAGYAEGTTPLIGRRTPAPEPQNSLTSSVHEDESLERALGVFKVESLTGQPIAFLINSGLEPVIAQAVTEEISADVAGAAERYVEQRYGDKAVAMYTVGSIASSFYNAREQGSTPVADPHAIMNAVGALLGEDVLAIAAPIRPSADVKISGAQRVLQCPGKMTTPLNNARSCSDAPGSKLPACVFKDTDTGPVSLQMGLLKIGDLRIVQADADVTPPVWQKLKRASPANTMLVALAYGPMHYVMADAAYPSMSYQVTATTAKQGCAEQGFVDTAQSMIQSR
jgi:neutral ceramidase